MIAAALGALTVIFSLASICVTPSGAKVEIRELCPPELIEETICAVMGCAECFVHETSKCTDRPFSIYYLIVNSCPIQVYRGLIASKSYRRVDDLCSRNWLLFQTFCQVIEKFSIKIAYVEFRSSHDEWLCTTLESNCWLSPRVLIRNFEIYRLADNWSNVDGCAAGADPRPRSINCIVPHRLDAIADRSSLILSRGGQVLVDGDLSVGLLRGGLHQPQLRVNSGDLLRGIFVGIFQRPIENEIGKSREYNSENKQSYGELFTKCALVIIGLFLILCGFKSVSYAVDRSKVGFVLIALFLQSIGVASVLYVIGFFAPFPH
jgi:hypothetical protein